MSGGAGIDLSALQKAGFSAGPGGGGGGGGGEEAEKRAAMEDARNSMLKSILTPEAKQRHRVALVRPENARAVEEHLIRLARSGKLGGQQVEEDTVKKMLDDVGKLVEDKGGAVKKITITRKKRDDDDDDDLEGL